jgi:hypothetical protein
MMIELSGTGTYSYGCEKRIRENRNAAQVAPEQMLMWFIHSLKLLPNEGLETGFLNRSWQLSFFGFVFP